MTFMLFGCQTVNRQGGGDGDISGQYGSAKVTQPENAEDPAKADYNESGVKIPVDKGDILKVTVIKNENTGNTKTEIDYQPKNKGEVQVSDLNGNIDTGSSYEDIVGQLEVFMSNAKLIMWVGIGFLAAGGVFAGFLRDVRSGIILGGIGAVMLFGYAILPQIYANYLIFVAIAVIAIPIIWWLNYKQKDRIAKASIKAYENLKIRDPELAKENSKEFKQHIKPSDLDTVKKLKNS